MDYIELAHLYGKLESTSKRLEKTKYLSEFLKNCPKEQIDKVMLLVQGLVFPKADERKIGIASKLVVKALNVATGIEAVQIEKTWKTTGDLGLTTEELIKKKKQHSLFAADDLTIEKVFKNIQKLASIEGIGSTDIKFKTIAELLTSAKPIEAKYIIRTLLEDLRVGLGEGTLRDAIAIAYYEKVGGTLDLNSKDPSFGAESELAKIRNKIQEGYDVTTDYAIVAKIVMEEGIEALDKLTLDSSKPVKVMLAQKAKDTAEAFETVGRPAAIEYKYDGFRMIIGKQGDKVNIHTRRLENVTAQFPEVAQLVRENVKAESCMIDGEAVGYDPKTKKYVPFQNISQRIKRKYDIEQLAKDCPVELNIFDIIYYDGESLIKKPFNERREIIEKIIVEKPLHLRLAKRIITDQDSVAEDFYKESLAAGNEGVMFKSLDAPYKPGSRVGYMVKLKPVMETLDVVIVKAEWGEGKRAGWLTSYTVAIYDSDTDEYLEIGKFGTGIKEKKSEDDLNDENIVSFNELTESLRPHIISESGREVIIRPNIVVELKFEEIQKSPSYSSGYALRFPRLVRTRSDRRPDESSTLSQVEVFYKEQY